MKNLDHPNDEGRWTRLEASSDAVLWQREVAFPPVTKFYVVAPPRQHEIFHDEARAREHYLRVVSRTEA